MAVVTKSCTASVEVDVNSVLTGSCTSSAVSGVVDWGVDIVELEMGMVVNVVVDVDVVDVEVVEVVVVLVVVVVEADSATNA